MTRLLLQSLLRAFSQVDCGQRLSRSVTQWVNVFVLWYFHHFAVQRIENHQCEGKGERAAVDAVYQDAFGHDDTVRLQPQGQVSVGHVTALAQFFNQRFSPSLVKLTGFHLYKSCIEINAQILKAIRTLNTNAWKLMHSYKPLPFTARQTRQVLNSRSP
jgi:hypothetical protein